MRQAAADGQERPLRPLSPPPETAPVFRLDRFLSRNGLVWFLMVLAAAFRLGRYLQNPAIWLDEAMLARSLLERGYVELLEPLTYRQKAPYGFLVLVRACVDALGQSEFALRMVSVCAALAAIPLLYLLARKWVSRPALAVALALFAFSEPLTRYAAELKQYSLDVFAALVLLLVTSWAANSPRRVLSGTVWALAGGVAVWFSHPAVFLLAGMGIALAIRHFHKRDWPRLASLVAAAGVWLASFGACFALTLREAAGDDVVRAWWSADYAPLIPLSPSAVKWYLEHAAGMFANPLGLTFAGIGLLLFLRGAYEAVRRCPATAAVLLLPLVMALLASGIRMYPFTGRFLLFFVPAAVLLVAVGFDTLRPHLGGAARALILAVLLVQPALESLDDLAMPDTCQGVRPALAYMARHRQPGDQVYVYHWAHYAYRYYAPRYGVSLDNTVMGDSSRGDWTHYVAEMEALEPGRTWFVFVETAPHLGAGEEKFFKTYLTLHAAPLDQHVTKWSRAYLYDLGTPPAE